MLFWNDRIIKYYYSEKTNIDYFGYGLFQYGNIIYEVLFN